MKKKGSGRKMGVPLNHVKKKEEETVIITGVGSGNWPKAKKWRAEKEEKKGRRRRRRREAKKEYIDRSEGRKEERKGGRERERITEHPRQRP